MEHHHDHHHWDVLKESFRLSVNAVPHNIHLEEITQKVLATEKVKAIHHLHIWAISTTQNAMTAHLVVENGTTLAETTTLKAAIKHQLHHLDIHHITLETELESERCDDLGC